MRPTLLLFLLTIALSSEGALAQKSPTYQIYKSYDGLLFVGDSGTGKTMGEPIGPKACLLEECQKWIKENWTDMRPLSLRKRMEADSLSIDQTKLRVVINHEEQYSIALADDKVPEGWKDTGQMCVLSDCQKYIEEVWTDMRPLSLRKRPGRTK